MTNETDAGIGNGNNDAHSSSAPATPPDTINTSPGVGARPTTIGPAPIALLVALVTVVVFLPATHNQFLLWDDNTVIYENRHLADPGYFWLHPFYQLYTPVTDTIFAAIAALFRLSAPVTTPLGDTSDLSPAAFHGANVVLHAANAMLVFFLIRMILRSRLVLPSDPTKLNVSAAIGALVFALHPLQVEAVAWVNGANNIDCGFFTLLALVIYLHAAALREISPVRGGPAATQDAAAVTDERLDAEPPLPTAAYIAWFALASLSFALALLAKPAAVTVPLAAVVIDVGIMRRPIRRSAPLLLWLLMSAAITVITRSVQPPGQVIPMGPLWFRPFVMTEALAFYVEKLFVPVSPAVDYGLNPPWMLAHTAWYAFWILPVGLGALLWSRRHAWPVISAAASFSALCLLPAIGLLPTYGAIGSVVADRYVYLAMIGPALAVAHVMSRTHPRIALPTAVLVIATMAWGCVAHLSMWADTNTVMTQTLAVNPRSWVAFMDRGIWRWNNGDVAGSIEDDRATHLLRPRYYNVLTTLPIRLMYKWAMDNGPSSEDNLLIEAEGLSRQAIKQAPWDPAAYTELGDVYHYLDRPADAAQQYQMVLELDPSDGTARGKLAMCLQQLRSEQKRAPGMKPDAQNESGR